MEGMLVVQVRRGGHEWVERKPSNSGKFEPCGRNEKQESVGRKSLRILAWGRVEATVLGKDAP